MSDCEKCKYYHDNCDAKFRCRIDVEQIRAEAIEELKPFIHKNFKGQKFIFVHSEDFKNLDLFEQLKEQN